MRRLSSIRKMPSGKRRPRKSRSNDGLAGVGEVVGGLLHEALS